MMVRLANQQYPALNAIVTVPTAEFSDDVASSSGGENLDVSDDACSPLQHGIDDRSPSSSLPVTKCTGVVPSVAGRTSLLRIAGHLGFITRRATFDAQLWDTQLVVESSSDVRQPRRPIVRCYAVQRSIAKQRSARQIVDERCHERRVSDCQRLVARSSTLLGEQDIGSTTDIAKRIAMQCDALVASGLNGRTDARAPDHQRRFDRQKEFPSIRSNTTSDLTSIIFRTFF